MIATVQGENERRWMWYGPGGKLDLGELQGVQAFRGVMSTEYKEVRSLSYDAWQKKVHKQTEKDKKAEKKARVQDLL